MGEYVGRHRAESDDWEELDQPSNVLPTLTPWPNEQTNEEVAYSIVHKWYDRFNY